MWMPAIIGFCLLIGFAFFGAYSSSKPSAERKIKKTSQASYTRAEKATRHAMAATNSSQWRDIEMLDPVQE